MTEAEFVKIRKIRMLLRDPIEVNDIIFANSPPPEKPDPQVAYYVVKLGNYQRFNERKNAWEKLSTRLSDSFITETMEEKGPIHGPIALIDFIIMGLQAGATSFSAGAQNVSGSRLREIMDFYIEKKKILLDSAGLNIGRTLRTQTPAVGGIKENW